MRSNPRFTLVSNIVGFIVAALVCFPSAIAQTTTANLYGIVQDSTGASVPAASVTITHEGTGQVMTRASDQLGEFSFSFLRVGNYTVEIQASGFKRYVSSGLVLSSGQQARLQFALELGAITESVNVVGVTPQVNTVSAEQQQTIDNGRVTELPLARRNFTNLLTIGTGVRKADSTNGSLRMNGMGMSGTNITLDGTYASGNPEGRSTGSFQNFNQIDVVSIEAIQEVQTIKGIAPAEYGNALGGQVNVITRSGTNEWHGSLFHNFQSEELNARHQTLSRKPAAVFNQFGGSAGGPILPNKIFLFSAFEGYRDRTSAVVQGNVPTRSIRNLLIAAVPEYQLAFDPLPLPNEPHDPNGTAGRFTAARSSSAKDNHAVIRGDVKLGSLSTLALTYTRMRPDRLEPRIELNGANDRVYTGVTERGTASYITAGATWTSETRFGFDWEDITREDAWFRDSRDPKHDEATFGGRRIGRISTTLGWSTTAAETRPLEGRTWSLDQKVALIRGRHSLKFGGSILHQQGYRTNPETPFFQYSSRDDLFNNRPSLIRPTFGTPPFRGTLNTLGLFAQDDFRVSPRLVLNLGLRYDYFAAFTAVPTTTGDAYLYNLDGLLDANFNFGPYRDREKPLEPDRGLNLGPRIGFAWDPAGNGRTSIRGGFGIMFSPHVLGSYYVSVGSQLVPSRVTFARGEIEQFGMKWPIYNDDMRLVVEQQAQKSGIIQIRSVYNPGLDNPYSIQWSLGIQRSLTNSLSIESAYVATRGVKFLMHRWFNQADRLTGIRPNPNIGEGYYIDNSQLTSYHSWQTSLRKRYANNLTGAFHYTWGKVIAIGGGGDNGSYYQGENPIVTAEFFDPRADRGVALGDITHTVASDWVYDLPRLATSAGLVRNIFGGWKISGILSATSGEAVNLSQSTAREGSRPDYIGGVVYLDGYRDNLQLLNRAAFAPVPISGASGAAVRPGNVGIGAVRGPSAWNVDMALAKEFSIREALRLRLRADAFNAFNHTNLAGLQTNVNSNSFGRLTGTRGARTMQLNLRLTW